MKKLQNWHWKTSKMKERKIRSVWGRENDRRKWVSASDWSRKIAAKKREGAGSDVWWPQTRTSTYFSLFQNGCLRLTTPPINLPIIVRIIVPVRRRFNVGTMEILWINIIYFYMNDLLKSDWWLVPTNKLKSNFYWIMDDHLYHSPNVMVILSRFV